MSARRGGGSNHACSDEPPTATRPAKVSHSNAVKEPRRIDEAEMTNGNLFDTD
jgi:hypothetical protein